MKLGCQILLGHFGPVYLLQVSNLALAFLIWGSASVMFWKRNICFLILQWIQKSLDVKNHFYFETSKVQICPQEALLKSEDERSHLGHIRLPNVLKKKTKLFNLQWRKKSPKFNFQWQNLVLSWNLKSVFLSARGVAEIWGWEKTPWPYPFGKF